jgi:bifunctional non-homologous end joining protein LigD
MAPAEAGQPGLQGAARVEEPPAAARQAVRLVAAWVAEQAVAQAAAVGRQQRSMATKRSPAPKQPRVGDLGRYWAKRDFKITSEPRGQRSNAEGRSFVIQKHAARRLHYDFRLELDGVLKSWAVPKGPSLDPADRQLAVHTEDHPLEYGSFEGVIPEGEYGGGAVMLWDHGTWEPEGDPVEGYRKGRLRFRLNGQKLHGSWTLARMGGRDRGSNAWLLIKRHDEFERPGKGASIVESETESVTTGRSMEQIAGQASNVWTSRQVKKAPVRKTRGGKSKPLDVPEFIAPELPTLVVAPPEGPEWLHEVKLDGYRMLCRIANRRVQFISRNGQDWTRKFLSLTREVPETIGSALIDGEVVVFDARGVTSFQALQEALADGRDENLTFVAFDLLYREGEDLREFPLEERKGRLAALIGKDDTSRFRFSSHIDGRGRTVLAGACDMALEGIISKLRDAPYISGRTTSWLKAKCTARQEFVIGGYTDLKTNLPAVGALLIGYYEDDVFRFAGKVGTGFTTDMRRDLYRRLKALRRSDNPFENVPRPIARNVRWVEPKLVAEIAYSEWTSDGVLRHPSLQGLREDKAAEAVGRDRPKPVTGNAGWQRPPEGKAQQRRPGKTILRNIEITHPDKVLYPEQGLTKGELATYYDAIAEFMLPHMVERPLTLVRCPSGTAKKCFYQKHPGAGVPDSLGRVQVSQKDDVEEQLFVKDANGLMALVQLGVIEFHISGALARDIERPDRIVFDLDPDPGVAWSRVIQATREVRDRLRQLRLESFVKTTGGKGLHVVVPIVAEKEWPEVKAFTRLVAASMEQDSPDRYTTNIKKAARKGRIFIDFLRNDLTATAVAPFSTRARPGATVATPIAWDELSESLSPQAFTIATVPERLNRHREDPWRSLQQIKQRLPIVPERLRRWAAE